MYMYKYKCLLQLLMYYTTFTQPTPRVPVTQLLPYLKACCGKHLSQEAEGGACSLCSEPNLVTTSARHFQLFSKAMDKVSIAYADKYMLRHQKYIILIIRHPPLLIMVLLHQELRQVLQGMYDL